MQRKPSTTPLTRLHGRPWPYPVLAGPALVPHALRRARRAWACEVLVDAALAAGESPRRGLDPETITPAEYRHARRLAAGWGH